MKISRKIIAIISAIIIILYIVWAIYLLIVRSSDTYIVRQGTLAKEDTTVGYIIRDEIVEKGEDYKNGIYAIAIEGQRVAKNEAIFPNNNPVIEITNNKNDDFFIKFPPINIIISKNNIVVLLF